MEINIDLRNCGGDLSTPNQSRSKVSVACASLKPAIRVFTCMIVYLCVVILYGCVVWL